MVNIVRFIATCVVEQNYVKRSFLFNFYILIQFIITDPYIDLMW